MCGLSLAWVTSENSTITGMPTSFDSIFFAMVFFFLWTLSSLLLSPESGVDCPCPWFHANSVFCLASLLSHRQLLSSGSRRQLAASSFVQPTLFRVPLPLPDTARFQVQESFVWFHAKTDKGIICFGGPPI